MWKCVGRLFALVLSLPVWLVACGGGERTPVAPSPAPQPQPAPAPAQTYRLSGIVRDYSGQPLTGVRVSVSSADVAPTSTDASGRYAFPAVGGALDVGAEAEGFYSDTRKLFVNSDHTQDLGPTASHGLR